MGVGAGSGVNEIGWENFVSDAQPPARKISFLTPNPRGGTHRSIAERPMGGGGGIRRQ
jgi:hypothetical protein